MLSRVFRVAPVRLASVSSRRAMHASASRRADLIQDLYSQEIRSFKPRTLTDKDAEGAVLKWATPATPKPPTDEIQLSELDSYTSAAVEVEGVETASATDDTATSGDWFPIESCDELDGAH